MRVAMRRFRRDLELYFPAIARDFKPVFAKELTSGAHALLLATRMCSTISIFGISAYGGVEQGGYQVRAPSLRHTPPLRVPVDPWLNHPNGSLLQTAPLCRFYSEGEDRLQNFCSADFVTGKNRVPATRDVHTGK